MNPYRAPLPPADCPACRARSEAWALGGQVILALAVLLVVMGGLFFVYVATAFSAMSGIGVG